MNILGQCLFPFEEFVKTYSEEDNIYQVITKDCSDMELAEKLIKEACEFHKNVVGKAPHFCVRQDMQWSIKVLKKILGQTSFGVPKNVAGR